MMRMSHVKCRTIGLPLFQGEPPAILNPIRFRSPYRHVVSVITGPLEASFLTFEAADIAHRVGGSVDRCSIS